ncbi:N-glycosylase/DNA lyase isoform X4 [Cynoglossus semilaevis]|uniref:N-glycosylase/DNA lyase isoform X4 n=1 Tax=Cynoglossus semilaevis TaxID=244447 RepID=UPI000D622EEA|nr:N-glycosylase/DNA lyase isoform X4 [Cynoglossus semilaevis]
MAKHAVLSSGTHLWRSLACAKSELRLDLTLACGQSFRWRETAEGHWTGVMRGRVWTLTQTDDTLWYHVYDERKCGTRKRTGDSSEQKLKEFVKEEEDGEEEEQLRDYFQLNVSAPLDQLDRTTYYDFPSLSALADGSVETRLRDLGFGYRAQFLQQSAKKILDSYGTQWLEGLRNVPYLEAHDALRTLPGVGTKVADCVCLMSLDKAEAVPVDTHVWQIAKRDYQFASSGRQKSITDKLHRDIGHFFRNLWGPYAGWTQSVLFCADLKKFQQLKETQSVEQPRNQEERVEEESDAAKSESKERSKPKKSNLCSEKTTTYVKKRRM